jgi:diguanylate cyclase (GGDEF)-like protein
VQHRCRRQFLKRRYDVNAWIDSLWAMGQQYYRSTLRYFVSDDVAESPDAAGYVTNLVNIALLACLVIPCFLLQYTLLGLWNLAAALTLAGVPMVGAPLVYKFTGKLSWARELFITSLFSFKAWESVLFGGLISPGSTWFIAFPVIAILLGSLRSAVFWLFVTIGVMATLQRHFGDNVQFLATEVASPHFLYAFSLVGLAVAISAFMALVENARKSAIRKLEIANKTISELAVRDALTGVYNRRHIWGEIGLAEKRATDSAGTFCVCLVDLDRFKSINDTYGHGVGDEVLRTVATAIDSEVRLGECFGRYGGEEFLLLLKETTLSGAEQTAERIRRRIEALRFTEFPGLTGITISIGLAEFRLGERFSETINRADGALYAAKAAGRNRVVTEA